MCAKHVRVEPSLMPAESQSENGALGSPRQDIGEYLIKRGLVRRDALEAALREQAVTNEQIGAILVRNGFVAYHDYVEAIL
ncbi:MAG: hypothetical protein K2Q10_01670, partial [Rhodospirillales bacterium]|nr:hypothetical protein [Rhodospirillales bacterium]